MAPRSTPEHGPFGHLHRAAALAGAVLLIALSASTAVALADDEAPLDPATVPTTMVSPGDPATTAPPVTEPPVTEPPVTEPPTTEPPTTEPPTTVPPTTLPTWGVGHGHGIIGCGNGNGHGNGNGQGDDKGNGDERCRPGAVEPRPPTTSTTEPPTTTTTAPTPTTVGGSVDVPGDDGTGSGGADPGDGTTGGTGTGAGTGGAGTGDASPAGPTAAGGIAADGATAAAVAGVTDLAIEPAETPPTTAIDPFGRSPLVDGEDLVAADRITPLPPFTDRLWAALPLGLALGLALVGIALAAVRIARLGMTP